MRTPMIQPLVLGLVCVTALAQVEMRPGMGPEQRFQLLDKDKDGKVTREEAGGAVWFDRLDRDGNGVITPQEVPGQGRRPTGESMAGPQRVTTLNIAYGEHPSQCLDIHAPKDARNVPTMVYVHGGGWRRGDKSAVGLKACFFNTMGWAFVSTNYRLLPEGKHPANASDVARALAWVHSHAKEYGGDPGKLFVMGHSAGAHLAALVASDSRYLKAIRKDLSILKGAIALDTNTYDLPALMESGTADFYRQIFGDDPDVWRDASPITHIGNDKCIPPFMVCYSRGVGTTMNPARRAQATAFAKALEAAGIHVETVDATDRSHGEISAWFGRQDDRAVTGMATRFLQELADAPRDGRGGLEMPDEPPYARFRDIRYAEIEDIDPNLLSLDIYAPKTAAEGDHRPVLIMIHGGGWRRGDKASTATIGAKMRHFVGKGYVYVPINYRLSSARPQADGVRHPVHAQDCAKAIAWVHDNISRYGGNPEQLHLMGHSAGGHLAGLLATNERFLKAVGKPLSILKTTVLLDPAALDIPRLVKLSGGSGMTALYENAFGTDESVWRDASPQQHVGLGKGIPPMLVFYAADRMRLDLLAPAFAASLTKAGAPSQAVDTVTLTHAQINAHIGMVGDPMTALIARLHAGGDASAFPARIDPSTANAGAAEPAEALVRFTRSYVPGTRDTNGQFMGGTETMRIVAHDGKLFAGLSYWTDQPGEDPRPEAQILVKRGPDTAWEVSGSFPGSLRINALEAVRLTTDHAGHELRVPAELLVADAGLVQSRRSGALQCFVYDERTDRWIKSLIRADAPHAFSRAFGQHRDTVTGVHYVFAGTGAGEVYRGSYDPDVAGRIRWEPQPEYANPDFDGGAFKRCQGFCVANGKLYASIAPRLLERQDGPRPKWREVFRWHPQERPGAGLRGITAVSAPDGNHDVILGSREQEGRILRIDPTKDYEVTDELNSQEFLRKALGAFRGGRLVAYNRFVPGKHPITGAPIHWVTVQGAKSGDANAAWLLIRHADATYEPVRVFDPVLTDPHSLVSTRTLEFAPWNPREFYTGGYDGAANSRKNHNTAWIYRGELRAH